MIPHVVFALALVVGMQTAIADEAGDAVEVLSRLWKHSYRGAATQFVGDSQTLRIRLTGGPREDGTVFTQTTEAPFRFLEIPTPDLNWSSLLGECHQERSCILVACVFKRLCVSEAWVDHDPIYQDPEREHTTYSKRNFAVGWVNPADAENVKQALRTFDSAQRCAAV